MIRFVVLAFLERGIPKDRIWVDYERRMACAVGKCGHCRMGDTYICVDGPVFRFDQAQHPDRLRREHHESRYRHHQGPRQK